METTFITIHDLSPDARILYASDSIVDVLGYEPEEVANTSAWEYFHRDELPLAKARHDQGLEFDKAAVLSYCRMRDKTGRWVGCEVVFTVVYDCMVGCTSIYRDGQRSHNRATDAPAIRRMFSSSPRDPRYHMLSHLSTKFTLSPKSGYHEPRAALFLNRYTRTLTIMYATSGLEDILGMSGEEFRGRSFYYCIEEGCLQDAIKCLENAKSNDSLAYLRFWFRDPRQDDHIQFTHRGPDGVEDVEMQDIRGSGEDAESGRDGFKPSARREESDLSVESQPVSSTGSVGPEPAAHAQSLSPPQPDSRTSSGRDSNPNTHEAIFGERPPLRDSSMSSSNSPGLRSNSQGSPGPIELEAVVSCTSDGLVVCLRRAHSLLPQPMQPPKKDPTAQGVFAVPWGQEPLLPPITQRPQHNQPPNFTTGSPSSQLKQASSIQQHSNVGGDFMDTIRDIAVFAWALTGINGSLADYSRGKPYEGSQPPSGLPIWRPEARENSSSSHGSSRGSNGDPFGDPGLSANAQQSSQANFIPHFSTTTIGPGQMQTTRGSPQ